MAVLPKAEEQDIRAVRNGAVRPRTVPIFRLGRIKVRVQGADVDVGGFLETEGIVDFLSQTAPVDGPAKTCRCRNGSLYEGFGAECVAAEVRSS
jgi:hypothetical protein